VSCSIRIVRSNSAAASPVYMTDSYSGWESGLLATMPGFSTNSKKYTQLTKLTTRLNSNGSKKKTHWCCEFEFLVEVEPPLPPQGILGSIVDRELSPATVAGGECSPP